MREPWDTSYCAAMVNIQFMLDYLFDYQSNRCVSVVNLKINLDLDLSEYIFVGN